MTVWFTRGVVALFPHVSAHKYENDAGELVFSCVFNSRTKLYSKTFGFHVFFCLPNGAETNTNRYKFPLCQQMASLKKKNRLSCGKSWLDKPTWRVFQIQQRFDKPTCGYVRTWAHCWKLSEESGHGRCVQHWEFAIRPSNWVTKVRGLYCLWGLGTFVAMFAEKYSYNIHIATYCVYFAMVPIENHTTAPVSYQQ